jgi:hypothetical protein
MLPGNQSCSYVDKSIKTKVYLTCMLPETMSVQQLVFREISPGTLFQGNQFSNHVPKPILTFNKNPHVSGTKAHHNVNNPKETFW